MSSIKFWPWMKFCAQSIYCLINPQSRPVSALCVLCCFSRVQFFATLWAVAVQAPLSMGFSRQEYWIAMPSPRASSACRDWTHVSYVSWVGRWVLSHQHHRGRLIWVLLLCRHWVVSNLCNPMNCGTPGFSVLHYLPECAQSHVHCQWCHLTISSSDALFSLCPKSFPALGSFTMSQLFASGGQSIGASASSSVLPMNIQDWFLLGLTGLISLQSKWLSRVFSSTTVQKPQFFSAQPSLWFKSHIHTWLLEKP